MMADPNPGGRSILSWARIVWIAGGLVAVWTVALGAMLAQHMVGDIARPAQATKVEATAPSPAATASSPTPSEVERQTPAEAEASDLPSEVPAVAEPVVASSGTTPVTPAAAMGQPDLAVGQPDLAVGQRDLAVGRPDLAVAAIPAPSIAAAASTPPPADHAAPRPAVTPHKGKARAKRDTRKRRVPSHPARGSGRSAPAAPKASSHSVAPSEELPNRVGPVQNVSNITASRPDVPSATVPTVRQAAAPRLVNYAEPVPAPERDLSRREKRDARPSKPLEPPGNE